MVSWCVLVLLSQRIYCFRGNSKCKWFTFAIFVLWDVSDRNGQTNFHIYNFGLICCFALVLVGFSNCFGIIVIYPWEPPIIFLKFGWFIFVGVFATFDVLLKLLPFPVFCGSYLLDIVSIPIVTHGVRYHMSPALVSCFTTESWKKNFGPNLWDTLYICTTNYDTGWDSLCF